MSKREAAAAFAPYSAGVEEYASNVVLGRVSEPEYSSTAVDFNRTRVLHPSDDLPRDLSYKDVVVEPRVAHRPWSVPSLSVPYSHFYISYIVTDLAGKELGRQLTYAEALKILEKR